MSVKIQPSNNEWNSCFEYEAGECVESHICTGIESRWTFTHISRDELRSHACVRSDWSSQVVVVPCEQRTIIGYMKCVCMCVCRESNRSDKTTKHANEFSPRSSSVVFRIRWTPVDLSRSKNANPKMESIAEKSKVDIVAMCRMCHHQLDEESKSVGIWEEEMAISMPVSMQIKIFAGIEVSVRLPIARWQVKKLICVLPHRKIN